MSNTFSSLIIRCVQFHHLWNEIHMNLKSKQLVYELKNISKGENTIYKYLARIEGIVCILDSIENMISHRDQLEAILDGFIDEYNALASIIQYPIVICPIIEAEYMLLSNESKIDKIKKIVIYESMFINLTQDNIFAHEVYLNQP